MQIGNRKKFGSMGRNPCSMVLTGASHKAGQPQLRVRCNCMAPSGTKPYVVLKYNPLGDVFTVEEARALWDSHVASLTQYAQEL